MVLWHLWPGESGGSPIKQHPNWAYLRYWPVTNSDLSQWVTTKFCTCHDSPAVGARAKFCCDHITRILNIPKSALYLTFQVKTTFSETHQGFCGVCWWWYVWDMVYSWMFNSLKLGKLSAISKAMITVVFLWNASNTKCSLWFLMITYWYCFRKCLRPNQETGHYQIQNCEILGQSRLLLSNSRYGKASQFHFCMNLVSWGHQDIHVGNTYFLSGQ